MTQTPARTEDFDVLLMLPFYWFPFLPPRPLPTLTHVPAWNDLGIHRGTEAIIYSLASKQTYTYKKSRVCFKNSI